jgi:hypothetical protein
MTLWQKSVSGMDTTVAPQLRIQSGFDSLVEHQGIANSFPALFSNLMLAQLRHLWCHFFSSY